MTGHLRRRYLFRYSGQDALRQLRSHDGLVCVVIRPLTGDEVDLDEIGPMSRVRFEDGYEDDVFDDELTEAGGRASW